MANAASTPPTCRLCGAQHWGVDHVWPAGKKGLGVRDILDHSPPSLPIARQRGDYVPPAARPVTIEGRANPLPAFPTDYAEVDGWLTVEVPDTVTHGVRIVWPTGQVKQVTKPAANSRAAYMAARRKGTPPVD